MTLESIGARIAVALHDQSKRVIDFVVCLRGSPVTSTALSYHTITFVLVSLKKASDRHKKMEEFRDELQL